MSSPDCSARRVVHVAIGLLLCLDAAAWSQDPPVIRPGETIGGEIADGDPRYVLFDRNLWQRQLGTHAALRAAQLEMIERNRERLGGDARPATWGAFVVDGDWR